MRPSRYYLNAVSQLLEECNVELKQAVTILSLLSKYSNLGMYIDYTYIPISTSS